MTQPRPSATVVHFDFRKLDVFSFGEEQNA